MVPSITPNSTMIADRNGEPPETPDSTTSPEHGDGEIFGGAERQCRFRNCWSDER